MSRFEGPQGIVTNGLVLNLDAGDPDSYTRSQPPFVEVLVVAGGGGGSGNFYDDGAGGGAGGLIYNSAFQLTNAAAITVTVGAGGAASTGGQGGNGGNSVFGSLTAVGGGGGAAHRSSGLSGGSGGGSAGKYEGTDNTIGGAGTAGQGLAGGTANGYGGSGGGGASAIGSPGEWGFGGNGGNGQVYSISGTSTYYAGGGGGYGYSTNSTATGGLGGGGNGGNPSPLAPTAGGTNTGGGGGGGRTAGQTPFVGTASGGSGIVIVRYPGLPAATGGTITYLNGYTIHTFTTSGTFTPYLWNDLSGGGRNGTLVNGVGFNSYQNGGILTFDGTDDYIQYSSLLNVGNTFTVNCWIKPTANTRQTIVSNGYPYSTNKGFFMTCPGNNSTDLFISLGQDQKVAVSGTSMVTTGVWQMVTARVNGASELIKLYINGVETTYSFQTDANITLQYDTGVFTTGCINGIVGLDRLYSNFATLQIYNRALSQAEITQNFNAQYSRFGVGLPSSGLIVNLDASNGQSYPGTGTTWYDLSGTGNNAILANGVTFSSANGGIFDFDGVDDFAYIADNATLDLAGDKTQGIWIYMDQSYGGTGMLGKADSSVNGMALSYGWGGGQGFQNIAWNSTNNPTLASSGTDINNWYYVAGVQNGDIRYIYVVGANGFRVASFSGGNHTWNNALNFTIGQVAGYYTNMKAGAVHVYNRALSAGEISAIYATQKSRFNLP